MYNTNTDSNIFITLARFRINTVIIVLDSAGSVTKRIFCIRVAPSISAASYSSGLIPARVARKIMVPQPVSFQILIM